MLLMMKTMIIIPMIPSVTAMVTVIVKDDGDDIDDDDTANDELWCVCWLMQAWRIDTED